MASRCGSAKPITFKPARDRAYTSNCRFGRGYFAGFKALAGPGDVDDGAMIGKYPVSEGNLGAGALKQCPGDKHPETKAAVMGFVRTATPRKIRFPDSFQDVGGEARSVVGNHDLDDI